MSKVSHFTGTLVYSHVLKLVDITNQTRKRVVLIASLLITVLSRSIKRHCAFSQVVVSPRLMLMCYVNFIAFMKNPEKTWKDFIEKEVQKAQPEPILFD